MYLGSSIVYSTANTVPVAAPITNNHHNNSLQNGNSHKKEIELENTQKLQRELFRKKSSRIETPPPAFETTINMGNGNTSNKPEDFNTRKYFKFKIFFYNSINTTTTLACLGCVSYNRIYFTHVYTLYSRGQHS